MQVESSSAMLKSAQLQAVLSTETISQPTAEETLSQPTTTTNTKKLPPSIKLGNRLILTSKTPRQWAWSAFTSSARKDTAIFNHWVRANGKSAFVLFCFMM